MTRFKHTLLAFIFFTITFCNHVSANLRGAYLSPVDTIISAGEDVIIDVAPETVTCHGEGEFECLLVRERNSQQWYLHYFGIEGFNFEAGNKYRLQIVKIQLKNPPADGSSERWVLKKILDKRKVHRGKMREIE